MSVTTAELIDIAKNTNLYDGIRNKAIKELEARICPENETAGLIARNKFLEEQEKCFRSEVDKEVRDQTARLKELLGEARNKLAVAEGKVTTLSIANEPDLLARANYHFLNAQRLGALLTTVRNEKTSLEFENDKLRRGLFAEWHDDEKQRLDYLIKQIGNIVESRGTEFYWPNMVRFFKQFDGTDSFCVRISIDKAIEEAA